MIFPKELIEKEVTFEAIRGRGPGGQNVNKVNSAAQMYWDYRESKVISDEEKHRIGEKMATLINKAHRISIRADEFRDLEKNKERCLEKLWMSLERAFYRPKKRKKTRPTLSSVKKKLDKKRAHGDTKKLRRKVAY